MGDRKNIVARIQGLGTKKVSPVAACTLFGQLTKNGSTTIAWAETNKDWCQVPEEFIKSLKVDNARATTLRGQACGAAAKHSQMERQAREQSQQQGSGLLGGGGLTGSYRIPQGAL